MADFELSSGPVAAVVSDRGATLASVRVPDRHGKIGEVTRGGIKYAGSVCGRFANRISNSHFVLDGEPYQLTQNEEPNHLHGGLAGFDTKLWEAQQYQSDTRVGVELKLTSPSGDEGYPGDLTATVNYWVDDGGVLGIDFVATTNSPTVLNLTNHAYWNLGDHNSEELHDHQLQVAARHFVAVNDRLIPTGDLSSVENTVFDLNEPRWLNHSYDHCFVLDGPSVDDGASAVLTNPATGRRLTMSTTQPGLQVYTADHAGRFGVALEAQGFPDAPNQPGFPSSFLRPGETYQHQTRLQFSTF